MRSCPPACRRAVQHPRLLTPETIWISDDVLSAAFQRFVSLSKSTRRYGSFVPGPLEARRRLGRRRMGIQLSESTPKSAYYFPPMWNIFGEVDRTRFQWEPPSTRSSTPEAGTGWLQYLEDWLGSGSLPSAPAPASSVSAVEDLVAAPPLTAAPIKPGWKLFSLISFRSDLRKAVVRGDDDRIIRLCNKLNKKLKEGLILGLVPDDMLLKALNLHRYELPDIPLRESLALAFCQELWDGITSSKKVVPMSMHKTAVISALIGNLSELPICSKVQTLAHDILCSSSPRQLQIMRESIEPLLHAWIQSWVIDECPSAADMSGLSIKAEDAMNSVKYTLSRAHSFLPSLEQGGKHKEWIEMHRLVDEARDGIHRSIEAADVAENILFPQRTSVALFARAIENLEGHSNVLASMLVQSCSSYVSTAIRTAPKEARAVLRFYWLSSVAQMRNVNDGLFVQIFKALNDPIGPILPRNICIIMIDRWITQGALNSPVIVRNGFKARGHAPDAIADLLHNLKRHNEAWLSKAEEVFKLLQKLDAYETVHSALTAMLQRGLKLPTSVILRALNNTSYCNAQVAYNIFHIWLPLRDDRRGLHIEKCPNFVLSLIASSRFGSKSIWDVLGLPIYHQVPPHLFPGFSNNPSDRLWPTSEALITKMAVGFAAEASRRPRWALRNVSQCLLYLRIRGNPITPELTKSLTLSGITMDMVRSRWVSDHRLAWSLKFVEQVEGTAVAEALDKQVFNYRKQLVAEREELRGQPFSPQWVREQQNMVHMQQLLIEREAIRVQSETVKQVQGVPRKEQQERRKQERERVKREILEERERLKQATLERQRLERERLDKDNERRKKKLEKLANEREVMESTMKEIEQHVEKKRARKGKELPKIKKQPQWGKLPVEEYANE